MNESNDHNLYVELVEHMLELNRDAYEKHNGRITNDVIPPVSVGCIYNSRMFVGDTALFVSESFFTQELKDIFKARFKEPIGQKGGPSGFRIGACAEQQTGNICMKNTGCSASDIEFTRAYQPRTFMLKSWCDNCHLVFDDHE